MAFEERSGGAACGRESGGWEIKGEVQNGQHLLVERLAGSDVNREFIPSTVTTRRDLTRNRFGCDETYLQDKDVLPRGSTEMNVVRYAAFTTAETSRPSDSGGVPAPLKGRPRLPVKPAPDRKPMTPEERHADMMRRFPRTMTYLAEH
jgi:hypothetical protein